MVTIAGGESEHGRAGRSGVMAGPGILPHPELSPAPVPRTDDPSIPAFPTETPPASDHLRARVYRIAVLSCGGALFAFLVISIGPATVVASFRLLSWRLVLLIVFPTVLLKTF